MHERIPIPTVSDDVLDQIDDQVEAAQNVNDLLELARAMTRALSKTAEAERGHLSGISDWRTIDSLLTCALDRAYEIETAVATLRQARETGQERSKPSSPAIRHRYDLGASGRSL